MPYARAMRTILPAAALAVALALAAGTAGAQQPPARKQQPLILQRQQLGTTSFATSARARMRSGDCAGALDAFDAAIAHSIDPSLRRDRGLCHEQLGQPYPAIDDYRAYLSSEPDAPDAEGIRGRLARLEQATSGKSSQGDDDSPPAGGSAGASATVTVGTGDASGQTAPSGKPRDTMDSVDHDNDQARSPLRRGKGLSFAPYFAEHKWFNSGASFGESDTWAECVGLQLRYSLGQLSTLFVEGAYEHFNSSSSSTDAVFGNVQGLSSQIGLELRFPLDPGYDNQFILAPGLGFEHLVESTTLASGASVTVGALVPRVRAGLRHMVDASAAIDLSLDFGVGKFAAYSTGDFPFGGNAPAVPLLAANAALVWGL